MGLDGQRKKRYERIFSYRSIMRLVFNDDDAAVWLVAFAVGCDAFDLFDGNVDDAAFSGVHWAQCDAAMGAAAFFGHALGEVFELVGLAFAIIFDVEDDAAVVFDFAVDDEAHEELDGVEGFAVAADEDADVFAGDVETDGAGVFGDVDDGVFYLKGFEDWPEEGEADFFGAGVFWQGLDFCGCLGDGGFLNAGGAEVFNDDLGLFFLWGWGTFGRGRGDLGWFFFYCFFNGRWLLFFFWFFEEDVGHVFVDFDDGVFAADAEDAAAWFLDDGVAVFDGVDLPDIGGLFDGFLDGFGGYLHFFNHVYFPLQAVTRSLFLWRVVGGGAAFFGWCLIFCFALFGFVLVFELLFGFLFRFVLAAFLFFFELFLAFCFASGAFFGAFCEFFFADAVHVELLEDHEAGCGEPVDDEPARHLGGGEGHDEWHDVEHHLHGHVHWVGRVHGLWVDAHGDLLLDEHDDAEYDRQDVGWVCVIEAGDPEEIGMGAVGEVVVADGPEEDVEDWQLDQDWQAAGGWLDVVFLIELHHFFGELFAVVGVLLLQALQLWLDLCHPEHGFHLHDGQRQQDEAHDETEDDDGEGIAREVDGVGQAV